MSYSIAQVVVGLPVPGPFDYLIPEHLQANVRIGSRVYVPFRSKFCVGYVVGLLSKSCFAHLKSLAAVLDNIPTLDDNFLKLTQELSKYYACSWGEAIEVALPAILRSKKEITWIPAGESQLRSKPQVSLCLGSLQAAVNRVASKIKEVLEQGYGIIFLVPEVGQIGAVREFLEKVCECSVGSRPGGLNTPSHITCSVGLRPGGLNTPSHITCSVGFFDRTMGVKEELAEWLSVKEGKKRVVIGTRSAVFTMMPRLGLIVMVDEDHAAYKQEPSPFYHAREIAFWRQKIEQCDLLFVSPAPTAELWKTLKDKKVPVEIYENTRLGELQVIDLANYKYQNMLVSFPLQNNIQETLAKGGRILLFLNRRGFSTVTKCNQCGLILTCGRCNTALSFLYSQKKMACHRCGALSDLPKICPQCQGSYLRSLGIGIEKLESELARVYPQARIAVFDRVTKNLLDDADIVVATQAVMPFLHRAAFSLIAVLDFDGEINRVDFRAGARAFSLCVRLRQAAGEKLVVQTRNPQHYAIKCVAAADPEKFYQQELKQRRELGFPPYLQMIAIALRGTKEQEVLAQARKLYDQLNSIAVKNFEITLPQPDLVPKLRDKFRFTVMLKGKTIKSILKIIEPVINDFNRHKNVILTVDVTP